MSKSGALPGVLPASGLSEPNIFCKEWQMPHDTAANPDRALSNVARGGAVANQGIELKVLASPLTESVLRL